MQTQLIFTARYAETDQMGIVHHSNYAIWFEAGRTHFLKTAGLSYSLIEASGVLLPLYELNCKFIAPAKYEDEVVVITTLKEISRIRVNFCYEVKNVSNDKLLATGETMHAWTNNALRPVDAKKFVPEIFNKLLSLNE